jgi:hypothetical protein
MQRLVKLLMEDRSGLLEAVVSEPFLDVLRALELHVEGFCFEHLVSSFVVGESGVVVRGLAFELADDTGVVFFCDNVTAVAVLHDVGGLMGEDLPDGGLVFEIDVVLADGEFVGDALLEAVIALNTCCAVAEHDGRAGGFDHVSEFLEVLDGLGLDRAAEGHHKGGSGDKESDHIREAMGIEEAWICLSREAE